MVHGEKVAPETWAVVAGRGVRALGSPLNVPPVLASNFAPEATASIPRQRDTDLGGVRGDTRRSEHGVAVAFASGMAAAAAIFDLLPAGAEIVIPDDCYQAVVGLAVAGQQPGRWTLQGTRPGDTDGVWRAGHADLLGFESPSSRCCTSPTCRDSVAAAQTGGSPSSTTPSPHARRAAARARRRPRPAFGDEYRRPLPDLMLEQRSLGTTSYRRPSARSDALLAGAIPGARRPTSPSRHANASPACRTGDCHRSRARRSSSNAIPRSASFATPACRRIRRTRCAPVHARLRSDDLLRRRRRRHSRRRRLRLPPDRPARDQSWIRRIHDRRRAAVPGQEHLPPTLLLLSVGCENVEDLWSDLDSAST